MVGLYTVYRALGDQERLYFLSPDPRSDLLLLQKSHGYRRGFLLTPPLPAGIAAWLLSQFRQRLELQVISQLTDEQYERIWSNTLRSLRELELSLPEGLTEYKPVSIDLGRTDVVVPGRSPVTMQEYGAGFYLHPVRLAALERVLDGRLLSMGELTRLLHLSGERGREQLWRGLQTLALTGNVALLPALVPVRGSVVRCQRCGWEGIPTYHSCAGCDSKRCCSCPDCLVLGGSKFCEFLYTRAVDVGLARQPERQGYFARLGQLFQSIFGAPEVVRQLVAGEVCCSPLLRFIPLNGTTLSQQEAAVADAMSSRASATASRRKPDREACASGGSGSARQLVPENLLLEIEFTAPQEMVARSLLEFEAGGESEDCLVWAACGAGKTEVSFPIIASVLNRGQRVLYATPRRDVVLELFPRLERAFGKGQVVPLYGGSGTLGEQAPLVLATTHQTLRCYRGFDLVVLDEGDAFPYPGNRMLHYGVERARRPGGRIIYLTATPPDWLVRRGEQGGLSMLKIPSRPHGFPLPEPQFLKLQPLLNTKRGKELHPDLLRLIKATIQRYGVPVFLFVPTVAMTRVVGEALRRATGTSPLEDFVPGWVEWSHASDQERDQKRKRFFAGEFPLLVTTTIMERGVTLPYAHVIVLEADYSAVFDTPTLVQMAGRCGRSQAYPTGEVWFVARRVSEEMERALAGIRGFNREAYQAGYLRPDYLEALQEIMRGREREVATRNLS